MKKILYTLPVIGGLLTAINSAGATTTVMSIPSIGDLLGYILDTINPFLTAFWPIIGLLAGLALIGAIIGKITNKF